MSGWASVNLRAFRLRHKLRAFPRFIPWSTGSSKIWWFEWSSCEEPGLELRRRFGDKWGDFYGVWTWWFESIGFWGRGNRFGATLWIYTSTYCIYPHPSTHRNDSLAHLWLKSTYLPTPTHPPRDNFPDFSTYTHPPTGTTLWLIFGSSLPIYPHPTTHHTTIFQILRSLGSWTSCQFRSLIIHRSNSLT